MSAANALKDQGNAAFAASDYDKAIDLFSQAIAIDPQNFVLYSNRSGAWAAKKQWYTALDNAEQCIKLNPSWPKGYSRGGAALHGARRFDDAIAAYEAGLKLELGFGPMLRTGLTEVEHAKAVANNRKELGPRDSTYYIADGNTVLLVEGTLFKVHRSNLIKDQSTFKHMFSLDAHKPAGVQGREGDSDKNPIHLQGDTVAEVRALMWSFYALPPEQELTLFTVTHFYHLGRIAHKYQFQSIEIWALNALTKFVSANTSSLFFRWGYPINLVHLTEVATLCDHSNLLAAVTTQWKSLIHNGKELGRAINMAERLGLQELLGLAYHAMMLKDRPQWDYDPFLSRIQRIRLLSGYHALTQTCEALPSRPPIIPIHEGWMSRERCANIWKTLWQMIFSNNYDGHSVKVLELQKTDLLGRVMLAESVMKALAAETPVAGEFKIIRGMCKACINKALEATAGKVKEVEDCLADLFTDVE